MDEPDTLNYIIRDLKGYVLGKEYTATKDRQIVERDKPSLISKLEYVTQSVCALGAKYGFEADINEFEAYYKSYCKTRVYIKSNSLLRFETIR